ncbi:MAG: NAD(P)-dependent glycerol-3-phosphate dehydrogenase [Alphaproteobacteria bacterium]|nr:NAD(P)-dependent glycerol-3-phosphate dehydrogenase [Alphaproteobacteria bacterium]
MAEHAATQGPYNHVGVIGAGAWGTALAIAAARAGRRVTLWSRNAPAAVGAALPHGISRTNDSAAAANADALLLVVPAQRVRGVLAAFGPHLASQAPVVVCAKGIERDSGKLTTEVLAEFVIPDRIAVLSGPSFARDVTAGLPTAVTIAGELAVAQQLQLTLGHDSFRPYASDDVTGVALGGAAKNVYAIACGILVGMGLGESARAALLSRSFAELRRFGDALGARGETLMGLSGLGDLVLTATSPTSRNFSFGLALGRGVSRAELERDGRPLAEGAATAPALVARGRRHNVELPVAETTAAILDGSLALGAAVPLLMSRPLKAE